MDDETVKTAKEFLEKNSDIKKKMLGQVSKNFLEHEGVNKEAAEISFFLGKNWYAKRVYRSLERIGLDKEGKLSRKAINMLPTEGTARSFVRAVKKTKPDLETQEGDGAIVELSYRTMTE